MIEVTGWYNGSPNTSTGAGFGIRIKKVDRNTYFRKDWSTVIIGLPDGQTANVNLTPSFWRNCSELRSQAIGKWMISSGLAPWRKGHPPRMYLKSAEGTRFNLYKLEG